jgi:hypothetical protein
MYTQDATYGWNMGPNEEFMVSGRDQILYVSKWSTNIPTKTISAK